MKWAGAERCHQMLISDLVQIETMAVQTAFVEYGC